jgi:phosphatidylglycerol:prolipoprotein diacylglycerol transferase
MLSKINIAILTIFICFLGYVIIQYPIDPVAIDFSYFNLKWYGILFFTTMVIARIKIVQDINRLGSHLKAEDADRLILYAVAGMIIGARLLYIIVYQGYPLEHYFSHPLDLIAMWKGGLSFHGGLIGLVVGVVLYTRRYNIQFLKCMDIIALAAPIGLAEGRIGNFINGELYGKVTDSPFGMVFINGGSLPRHPSQLYECILEGIVLFFILKFYASKDRIPGSICGLFMVLYSIFRFAVEFVREPDSNLGYIAFGWLTMGQILCIPMLIVGVVTMNYIKIKQPEGIKKGI